MGTFGSELLPHVHKIAGRIVMVAAAMVARRHDKVRSTTWLLAPFGSAMMTGTQLHNRALQQISFFSYLRPLTLSAPIKL